MYNELLKNTAKKYNSIVCLGLDPVLSDIPLDGKPGKIILSFYEEILNKIIQRKVYPSAVKPNYAFYAQYGIEGIEALHTIISLYKNEGLPIILDVKRGDIGKTAAAYAKEAFDFFQADAVTLSPYLGYDSIGPFIDYKPEGGFYMLVKTSNKTSVELQDVQVGEEPFFLYVAKKIMDWYQPGLGAVVGATFPEQLDQIVNIINNSDRELPLLIPGIGSQGGDLKSVLTVLENSKDYTLHRINSSSAINYAYKKKSDMHFADAAVDALEELNNQISELIGA